MRSRIAFAFLQLIVLMACIYSLRGVALAADALAPVTVRVVNGDGGESLTNFSYSYWIAAPGENDAPVHKGTSSNGQFSALAPPRCELNFTIAALNLVGGFRKNDGAFMVSETNRQFVFRANRGVWVEGEVVAADTGKPVAGAEVSPIIFSPPLFVPDRERSVATDARGRFAIGGVDKTLGVGVSHPDFQEENRVFNLDKATTKPAGGLEVRIKLERGATWEGVVSDNAGNLLAGVEIESGEGKRTATDAMGRFRLKGLLVNGNRSEGSSMLRFVKSGYVTKWLENPKVKDGRIVVVLERQPEIKGRVVDADGRPWTDFTVWAGPGQEPGEYSCSHTNGSANGTFQLSLEGRSETNWIGITAPGFAPWFGNITRSNLQREVLCRLVPGTEVRLTGVRGAAQHREGLHAKLRLSRITPAPLVNPDDPSMQQIIATQEAEPDANGVMRFQHVGPGRYRLAIRGSAISPFGMDVTVSNAPVDLGEIRLRGTGTIEGRIYPSKKSPVKPAYGQGEVRHAGTGLNDEGDQPLHFTSNADGLFRVEHVPVGDVHVSLPYMATADICDAIVRRARVVEGRTTEVIFFEPRQNFDLRIRFRIGDGSQRDFESGTGSKIRPPVYNVTTRPPMFHCTLDALGERSLSWDPGDWQEMDADGSILLHDVQPGSYRLKISDWHGSIGFPVTLLATNVQMRPNLGNFPIQLGAGSIGGTIDGTGKSLRLVHILAAHATTPPRIRETWCDEQGHFCLRFLEPGRYTIFAHDHAAGWCDLGTATVSNQLTYCQNGRLQPGGTLQVELQGPSKALVARDDRGCRIEPHPESGHPRFYFQNLWPGRWTIENADDHSIITNGVVQTGATTRIIVPSATP